MKDARNSCQEPLSDIRVSKWSEAVSDCNTVLKTEPGNVKAKLRRAVAYKSLRKHKLARQDLDFVLKVEPQNKRAKVSRDTCHHCDPALEKVSQYSFKAKFGFFMKCFIKPNACYVQLKLFFTNQDMIAELDKEEEKSKGSHRMVIEETDGESSDEEEIICNKPIGKYTLPYLICLKGLSHAQR